MNVYIFFKYILKYLYLYYILNIQYCTVYNNLLVYCIIIKPGSLTKNKWVYGNCDRAKAPFLLQTAQMFHFSCPDLILCNIHMCILIHFLRCISFVHTCGRSWPHACNAVQSCPSGVVMRISLIFSKILKNVKLENDFSKKAGEVWCGVVLCCGGIWEWIPGILLFV